MTLNGKKKSLQSVILVKKKFLQIVMWKKKKNHTQKLPPPPPFSTPTKIKWSVPNSIQKQIVEYNIKSEYPEEYSIVDKVGSEKPLASKSCFA